MPKLLRIARLLVLLCLASCARVFSRSSPAEVFSDDFDAENAGVYELNYTGFARWEVVRGSVDLIGTPPFDDFLPAEYRLHVDLDGTTKSGGRVQTRDAFLLKRGPYRLSFVLAGCPRPSAPNAVTVSLGELYEQRIELPNYAPVRRYTRVIHVPRTTSARIVFDHSGGDDYGILLDNVELRRL